MNASARKIRLAKGDENTCPKCGRADIASRTYSDIVEFRDLELDIEGLHESTCNHCGYVWATPDQTNHNNALIRTLYAEKRDRIRAAQGLLSGQDVARIREELGLNQREAAALFGGGYNAFNKYESGEVLQSFAMDRLLRLSKVIGKSVVAYLRDVYSPPPFVVISTASTFTTSDTSYTLTPPSQKITVLSRNVQTSTDADSYSVQQYQKTRWNKHENHAPGR